ncbi:MAG: aldehyde dehydrogenase [Actinobacteria bacterium]|jgi:acyl-CoA reductase-like NAD-dependent aldehyde dehydrogenase|nr:aldehyde dehydrogenase [Actinomycetota bacterium]NBT25698.1 aldehyde dehydrogenase [Actinomycetota bacterium]NCZ89453.1 aldehyde dehydrogenase [Actinomycetota bacterium]NCZ91042.1 aldehyde dehydrogenase [Actinomycetota bacterium]NCZ92979.1 aldehyde dehydrogenase [Actinomycetota bacterium]
MAMPTKQEWTKRAEQKVKRTQLFINGKFVDAASGKTFESINPRDGKLIANVAEGDAEDVNRAVAAAKASFEAGVWREMAPLDRKKLILRWVELINAHAEELALLETMNCGKPISDSLNVDVASCSNNMQWYAECIDKLYGEIAPIPRDSVALIEREPMGVVGAVVPWNYPLIITSWKVGAALAAGNSVVLKPAEQSPLSALLFAELATQAGLPDGVLNVVPGFGPTAGGALGRHMDVNKLAFTGSTEVGKYFLKYAAESNAKAVSLELGGKTPHVVLGDLPDVDAAASAIAWGVFYNAGQTCHAGTRVIVDARVEDELLDKVREVSKSIMPGDTYDPATAMGTIVDRTQFDRVNDYIKIGESEGAKIHTGGRPVEPVPGGVFIPPTIFKDVKPGMRIEKEEIFGPVLGSVRVTSEEEAVRIANDTQYGLGAALWTRDVSKAHKIARQLRAGTVWVNTFDRSSITTPFGGFKQSGTGRDRSLHSIEGYTNLKTTWIQL